MSMARELILAILGVGWRITGSSSWCGIEASYVSRSDGRERIFETGS
ncbi:hypothetical protein ES702_05511 [subsurface metagenome]